MLHLSVLRVKSSLNDLWNLSRVVIYSMVVMTTLIFIVAKPRTCIRYFRSTNVALSFVLKYTKEPQTNRPSFLFAFMESRHFRRDKKKSSKEPLQSSGLSADFKICFMTERAGSPQLQIPNPHFSGSSQVSWSPDWLHVWPGCSHTSLHEFTKVTVWLETLLISISSTAFESNY